MGAKKRRQEEPCWQKERSPTYTKLVHNQKYEATTFTNPGRQADCNRESVHCSPCCNVFSYADISEKTDELTKRPRESDENRLLPSSSTSDLFSSFTNNLLTYLAISKTSINPMLISNITNRNSKHYYDKSHVRRLVHLLILVIIASSSVFVRPVHGVCVWQGGGGFKVACGFRQSGLFRIRSIGGIKGYLGGGFTIGDEDGFKDSLTNTEGQQQQSGPYVIPNNVHSQRSLPQNGMVGQYSQIYEHAVPHPRGDPASQQQQKTQYLDNIQNQMDSDHQNLQLMAADQQTQKMLEQQLQLQGGLMPPAPLQHGPATTPKVKRAGSGGLTKRASLWNWPNIFRGKNGKNKRPNKQHNGSPPPQGANRRGGPPHANKLHKPPHGKNGPPPGRRGGPAGHGRRGPFPPKSKNPRQQQRPQSEAFINPMQNPFAHLQENFVGKSNSQEAKHMHNFQQGRDHINEKFATGRNQFPPQPFTQGKNFFDQGPQAPYSGENRGQLPPQLMMPPAGSPETFPVPADLPKFKKIPNNKMPIDRQDDYVDEIQSIEHQQYAENNQSPTPTPAIDRMMIDADDDTMMMQDPTMMQDPSSFNPPPDYFGGSSNGQSQGSLERQFQDYEADPAGLKLLKQTENFGTIYHLINPDGTPVNMQFEKHPTVPPLVEFSSQQQQDLVDELSSVLQQQPNSADVGMGGELMDSQLATAVYDPNVFPDIYFTTTEKHNMLQSHNMLGGTYGMSQEMLDNPLYAGNQIKRILGTSSIEKTGSSSEGGGASAMKQVGRKKASAVLRSSEVSSHQQQQAVTPRRKMRRRKKFRLNQQINNQVDTSEHDLTGPDASAAPAAASNAVMPKRRRKGRRKKKYKLQTMSPHAHNIEDAGMASSTERMGLPAGATGGGFASSEAKTETPIPAPLTTTPAPQPNVVFVTPTSPVASSADDFLNENNNVVSGDKKIKTSFSLPSSEDVTPNSLETHLAALPSSENAIDASAGVTPMKKTSEETTTRLPISFSTFGYFDALRGKNKNEQGDDYDFSGPSGPGDYFRGEYDPRFPPDHEVNKGHNMSKFIRPRGPNSPTDSTTPASSDVTNGPFILYDMTGTRNQSRFSSKFHKETSPFRLDGDPEPNRVGSAYGQQHPFYANNKQNRDKSTFLKLDSREWPNDKHYQNDHPASDPFSNHYNKTSLNNGGYYGSGASKEFRPSVEIPWDKSYNTPPPTTQSPYGYAAGSKEKTNKFLKSSGSVDHGIFGPTMETFGLPKSSTPLSPSSGEKQQRKLHKNIFGGSSADVTDMADWASPNFWGTLQQADRYSPSVDFDDKNNNLKRLMTGFGDPNGLKEMKPADLSSPTPLPAPSSSQSTMEDLMDGPTYFLPPSTPGDRWGKQRKRKGRPSSTVAPTTPSSVPFVMSTTKASPTPTSAPSAKWLAMMSNEVDMPSEYYDNLSMLSPGSLSLEMNGQNKKKEKIKIGKGIEIKIKSGEVRDPEEEEEHNQNTTAMSAASNQQHFDILGGFPSGASGFPGVMVHDFDSSAGFGFGEREHDNNNNNNKKNMRGPPPPPPGMPEVHIPPFPGSDVSYFPTVNSDSRDRDGKVSSGPTGPSMFPPMSQFGPPPTHNNNDRQSGPIFPGREDNNNPRREFVPSAEDLGPLPPLPPSASGTSGSGSGLHLHKDNPFKVLEKQNVPVNSGLGFVSTNQELKEMADQISKFAITPNAFSRRDSSEESKMGGAPNNMDGDGPEFHNPSAAPPSSSDNMNIPGFITIPLPNMNQNPVHNMVHNGANPTSFGPSGFPSGMREPDNTQFSGPPSGQEEYHPQSMPTTGPAAGMHEHDMRNSRPLPEIPKDSHDAPWDFNPLENNELGAPPSPHGDGPTSGHVPQGRNRPPFNSEQEFRRPQHDKPPNIRDGPPAPPQHIRDDPSGPPAHLRDGSSGPPSHMRDNPSGPPPHLRDNPSGPPPPHMRDSPSGPPPPHMRDGPPRLPPHMQDGPPGPPPHLRENQSGPPPYMKDNPSGPPPPPLRDGPPRPPPHMQDGPPGPPGHLRDYPSGPPPHMRDSPSGVPPHMRDGPPGPPHLRNGQAPELLRPPPPSREDHERLRPPHGRPPQRDDHPPSRPPPREEHPMRPPPLMREDHPRRPPPPRDDHLQMRPPPREDHPHMRPPPREDHPPMRPPPSLRDEHHNRPPPREDHPPMRPPPREDHPHLRPPPRDDHPPMRPPPREDHPPMRHPPREDHPTMRHPPREDHPPMRPPPREDHPPMRPPPSLRDEHHNRPPPRDEHLLRPPPPPRDERPPPPRGSQGAPPGYGESERRPPPPHDFERDFGGPPPHSQRGDGPPRYIPEERFRDGPHQGHEPNRPPRPNGPPATFLSDHHKPNDNHRPPPRDQFHDKPHEHRGEHSSFNSWMDEKDFLRGDGRPSNLPPVPHGMPDFLDLQKVPKKDQRPFKEPPSKSSKDSFLQKHPPPPGGKKQLPPGNPTKIPQQVFKPPPKSHQHHNNFFSNILHGGPFGKHTSSKMHQPPPKPRPHQMPPPPNSRPLPPPPPPNNPPPRKPPVQMPSNDQRDPNNPNNYINPFNDRYKPPSHQFPPHMDDPNHKLHLRPDGGPPPPMHSPEQAGSRLPFLPFPQGPGGSFETSLIDLDQDPHAHLVPPKIIPLPNPSSHQSHLYDPSLPVRNLHGQHASQKETPRPVYQPKPTKKIDEKTKIKEAFETLNKANFDVIHSIAADQFGQKFMDKIKTKSNIQEPLLPPKPAPTTPAPLFNMFAALTHNKNAVQGENAKLAELLKMINNKSNPSSNKHLQPIASASVMGASSGGAGAGMDRLSSLLQKLSNPVATTPPTTTTTAQRVIPELPSNPGLVSLTSLNQASGHDIKSLQAQIAKAIIAKAHKNSHPGGDQVEKPQYQALQVNAPGNESPLAVLQQLAQNRQDTIQQHTASKNYTASQIETLKKLLALNNLEHKIVTTPATTTSEDPLKKLQALLPAAIEAAKQPQYISSNTMTRKMLDSSTANSVAHHHNNHMLQSSDPRILALKALAMSKSHGINPQPSISLPQQVKPTEPSSQPIAVDLSAILSPSPPVVEASRKRRLTNVRNAPKSFYPANATQGFEEYSGALITDFQCDEQAFFPGLYADTELGCRVFHLCAKTEAGYMIKSFRCPKETVFDQEVLRCNWNLFVECPASKNKYHFNKYLSQSFQFLKILGEFSANIQKSDATMTG